MKQQNIPTVQGHNITARVYGADGDSLLIIASATGVKQTFYQQFAEYLSSQGITVITFDYQGIGASLNEPIQSISTTAAQWGSNDLEAVIQWTNKCYPTASIAAMGHSIGGQLLGLAPSSTTLKRIVLVAAQSGYWKFWQGLQQWRMWTNWYLLFPTLVRLFGYMPSKRFSGMENLPKQVALQWSRWCRNKDYLFTDIPKEEQYFHRIQVPVMSFSIDKDPFAPQQAVNWLTLQYTSSVIQEQHLHGAAFGVHEIGHFGIFKEKFRSTLWPLLYQACVK